MTRLIGVLIITGIVVSPFALLNLVVMPQLNEMRHFYSTMDETAQKVADGAGAANYAH